MGGSSSDSSDELGGESFTAVRGPTALARAVKPIERPYFLVIAGNTSRMHELPLTGEIVIGRAEAVALRIEDSAVSRRHATVSMVDGEASIRDLGSQNGTLVNGEKVVGCRALVAGDVVTISDTGMVFHVPQRPPARKAAIEALTDSPPSRRPAGSASTPSG